MSSPATTAPNAGGEATMPVSGPRKTFKTRHLSMMALGSAIGAGFFLGTGVAVAEAGPAVLVSYVLAALIAVSVMFALSELASSLPSTGSFSTYAEVLKLRVRQRFSSAGSRRFRSGLWLWQSVLCWVA